MTEIKKIETGSPATSGMVVAQVDVVASIGLSFNNARAAGKAALLVVSSRDIHSSAVHAGLKLGGHSSEIIRGSFLKLLPPGGLPENSLQELSDGTSIHIAEEKSSNPLQEAPKSALVQGADTTNLSRREISRRFIMNLFSTSNDPKKYGLQELLAEKKLEKAA